MNKTFKLPCERSSLLALFFLTLLIQCSFFPYTPTRTFRKVCNLKWLGLRGTQILRMASIGIAGLPLSLDDVRTLRRLKHMAEVRKEHPDVLQELELMRRLGKHELQWVYGHELGAGYMARGFVVEAILKGDYI